MLALQIGLGIAGGIILAYIIIRNEQQIVKLLGSILQIAGCLLIVALGSAGVSYGATAFSIDWADVIGAIWFVTILICYVLGGAGLVVLYRLYRPKKVEESKPKKDKERAEGLGFIFLMVANGMFVVLITYPLLAFTPIGGWWEGMDAWSRASGYADRFSMFSNAVATLWPWVFVWFVLRRRAAKKASEGKSAVVSPETTPSP